MLVTGAFDYFFLTGGIAVVFALVVSLLGLTSSRFPGRAMPVLMLVSVVLFFAGILGAALGAKYKAGERSGPEHGPVAGHKGG